MTRANYVPVSQHCARDNLRFVPAIAELGVMTLKPQPSYMGLHFAEQFKDKSIVEAHSHRPPIPDAVFKVLGLVVDAPRA